MLGKVEEQNDAIVNGDYSDRTAEKPKPRFGAIMRIKPEPCNGRSPTTSGLILLPAWGSRIEGPEVGANNWEYVLLPPKQLQDNVLLDLFRAVESLCSGCLPPA